MGIRFGLARAASTLSTWGLKHVFRRPAANFPGKLALYIDPQLIADLRGRVDASICVVGTNGKTTVTNLLADAFQQAGRTVICNRTGANLDSGVATALLHGSHADQGVFECDELWLTKILPFLQSDYVLLLNLFRDQLDRVGEIDHIQESIAGALRESPDTILIYNADDPLCQAIADRVPNTCVPFGVGTDLQLHQNTVADARMCQRCPSMLHYEWRQYGQLGSYRCPACGFARAEPAFSAQAVEFSPGGVAFTVQGPEGSHRLVAGLAGVYMVYNLLAVAAAARLCGVGWEALDAAIAAFDPRNGRLQRYAIDGHPVLLNLAKNPTGFNQNLDIVLKGEGPKAVAFFVNDKEADGRDMSWLWDIDFQQLAEAPNLLAYAGGIRRNDMQVRLKYAGVPAALVDDARDFLQKALAASPDAQLYVIANYTALPAVKEQLDRLSSQEGSLPVPEAAAAAGRGASAVASAVSPATRGEAASAAADAPAAPEQRLVIVHLFPKLLNLYGDGGNITVLAQRARWHGLQVEVRSVDRGDDADLAGADIVFLGGGPDREQRLACQELQAMADDLRAYVEDDGVLLAICGGYQVAGRQWLMGDEAVAGLALADIVTERALGGSHNRLVGNVALSSPWASHPVVGYENHAGRTFLGPGMEPFGTVCGNCGKGNNGADRADGILYRNMLGTYLHGPLLAKNPEVADELIRRALERRRRTDPAVSAELRTLDDSVELAANAYMCERLGVRRDEAR